MKYSGARPNMDTVRRKPSKASSARESQFRSSCCLCTLTDHHFFFSQKMCSLKTHVHTHSQTTFSGRSIQVKREVRFVELCSLKSWHAHRIPVDQKKDITLPSQIGHGNTFFWIVSVICRMIQLVAKWFTRWF